MSNYIEFFYDNEGRFIAQIHKNEKVRTVSSQRNVEKLIDICYQYGYDVQGEGYIDSRAYIPSIIREYENYYENNKKRKLNVLGNITNNMKLSRKNKGKGNRILAIALTMSLLAGGYGAVKGIDKNKDSEPEPTFYEMSIGIDSIEYETPSIIEEESREVEQMLDESFHFSFRDRSNGPELSNVKQYEDIFQEMGHRYGVDPNLLMAIAAQESAGDHYGNIDRGPACGIMQIEKSVNIGTTIRAYNFEIEDYETIEITEDNLKDIETNIQIGTMILRNLIRDNDYNIPIALQTYNFGYGNMEDVIEETCNKENTTESEIFGNPNNNKWLNHRDVVDVGDPLYLEHVFSFLGTDHVYVINGNHEQVSVSLTNDYLNEKTY